MAWKRSPNLFRFRIGAVRGSLKWMVGWLNIVCGLFGIGTYTRMVSEGGFYHPVCIQFLF